jgi:hypothetical protein
VTNPFPLCITLNLRSIANIECCSKSTKGDAGRIDSKALGIVMMRVMEKNSQPKGFFGLQHPERWSEDAVEFLSMTQVSTPEKLAQVSPFNQSIYYF